MIVSGFVGAIPTQMADQIGGWVRTAGANSLCVLCSGSLRIEDSVRSSGWEGMLHGNDVGLASCAVGRFLSGDDHGDFEFTGPAEPLNDARSRALAVVGLYGAVGRWKKRWQPKFAELDAILKRVDDKFPDMVETRKRIQPFKWTETDLRVLARETDADAIVGYPPVYKGGYEKLYAKAEEFVLWERPEHSMFERNDFVDFARELDEVGKPYLLGGYGFVPELGEPVAISRRGWRREPMVVYGRPRSPMLITHTVRHPGLQFMDVVDPETLHADSNCRLHPFIESAEADAVATAYSCVSSTTGVLQIAVMLDGKFAGAIGFGKDDPLGGGGSELMVLRDFAVTDARRLEKLIVMLTACEDIRRWMEARHFRRWTSVTTPVLSMNPSSMKMRGTSYRKKKAKAGDGPHAKNIITYQTEWTGLTAKETYGLWHRKHANAGRRRGASQ